MTDRSEASARALYRLLLRAYPRSVRERDGDGMEDAFVALLRREGARNGPLGRLRCWTGVVWDTLRHAAAARAVHTHPHDGGTGGWEIMGTFVTDVRFALRTLARRPAFALTAIATLALGIGINVAIFTVVNGILFMPLPYERPDELVSVYEANPELGWDHTDVGPADAWDWRARSRTLADLAVYASDGFNLTGDGAPELVAGIRTTPNLLRVLGRPPALGRDFAEDEMGEGRDGVAILTDGFWERRFGRAPEALGATLTLDGHVVTVVGILPPTFVFLDERIDVMVPWGLHPTDAERAANYASAIARLAPGATVSDAQRELTGIAAQLAEEYPDANEGWTVELSTTRKDVVGDVAIQASIVLMAAVGFILLMACVNVANLLLARAGGRRQEMAVRTALGAGRRRVVRQLLTESGVLAVVGGGLGLLLAGWGYRVIVAALPSDMPPVLRFRMEPTVFVFAAAVSVAAALVFGLAPALSATRDMSANLREGGRGGRSRRAGRLGNALVVLQTALAVVLLVSGTLLMKSLSAMRTQDFGFDPGNTITMRISPTGTEYPETADVQAFWDAVEQRVRELPGVVAVGTTQSHPLMGSNWGAVVRVVGRDAPEEPGRRVRLTYASPGLFEALRFELLRGRGIASGDGPDAPGIAVVNEAFVARYLTAGQDPLTTSIRIGDDATEDVPIVGVIHDVVERAVDRPPEPSLYASLAQHVTWTRSLVVRTSGDPGESVSAVQEAVWSVDPAVPLYRIETMEELMERRLGGFRVIGYLMGTFAVLSLLLGAVGIYGVTAHAAGQRTGEIGLRLAMGAERGQVIRLVVGQGARRAALGLALGLGLAFLVTGAMSRILIGVSRGDPATFAGVTAVLGIVSIIALWLPARRASRVDPVRALAAE